MRFRLKYESDTLQGAGFNSAVGVWIPGVLTLDDYGGNVASRSTMLTGPVTITGTAAIQGQMCIGIDMDGLISAVGSDVSLNGSAAGADGSTGFLFTGSIEADNVDLEGAGKSSLYHPQIAYTAYLALLFCFKSASIVFWYSLVALIIPDVRQAVLLWHFPRTPI